MKLYAEYIKERENAEIVYNEKGFVTYKKDHDGILIMDAFVKKENRNNHILKNFIDLIIDKTKTSKLYATTDSTANDWETSERVILALGFNKFNIVRNTNYYIKEINNG